MPTEMRMESKQLPLSVWSQIIDQIPRPELLPLMFVNRKLRALVIHKIYRKAVFSADEDDGYGFALAIRDNYICPDVVSAIRIAEVTFSNYQEASGLVWAISSICENLNCLRTISVSCPNLEDAVWAVNTLVDKFPGVLFELSCTSSSNPGSCVKLSSKARKHIDKIAVAVVNAGFIKELPNLRTFSAGALLHDTNCPVSDIPFIDTLILSFSDWATLNFPTSRVLELDLYPNYICVQRDHEYHWDKVHVPHNELLVNSTLLEELKLVGSRQNEKIYYDMDQTVPNMTIKISSHCLKRLFICNLPPRLVESMLRTAIAPALELITLYPTTIPCLSGLLSSRLRPKLVFAVVTEDSFPSRDESEIAALTMCLQDTAAVYPLDLRDLSDTIDREIYFSDGMWCNIAQTRFKHYALKAQP